MTFDISVGKYLFGQKGGEFASDSVGYTTFNPQKGTYETLLATVVNGMDA